MNHLTMHGYKRFIGLLFLAFVVSLFPVDLANAQTAATPGNSNVSALGESVAEVYPAQPTTSQLDTTKSNDRDGALYTVQRGESLFSIAQMVYGDFTHWRAIYAANTELMSANPQRVKPGQVLQLPVIDEQTSVPCANQTMTAAELAAYRNITLQTLRDLQRKRGHVLEEICTFSDAKLARAITKADNPKPDHPDEAVQFRLTQLRDENGQIPADGLAKAAEQIREMQANPPPGAGISPNAWTWLGPGNIGGRVRSIVIHPTNTDTMWTGSVAGGIWKSTDGGASWQVEDDFMSNMAVSTMVMDPATPNTIYAGTGEGFYNADGIQGAGVFKTTDGGATWNQLPSTATTNWQYVNRLAIHPTNGQILLAATRSGIWRSTNGGSTWTSVLGTETLDLDFDPSNGNNAIASGRSGQAWYSTNGGQTWTAATGIPAANRVEVAYAPSNPSIVYASVERNSGEIYKSANGGQSYTLVNTGNGYLGSQGWYDNIVWVDPTDSNTLIVGGIDLWRSVNGGATLTKVSQWFSAPTSAHADHHYILEHPDFDGTNNTTVFFGNDGGVYKTGNVYSVATVTGWQELNNNLGITQFYGAAGNATSGVIVGGTQDNGTLRYSGNTEGWTTMFGGDGGWSASDPTDPNYFYGEYVRLQIHRSTNGGATSSYIYQGIGDAGTSANFIAPFILDPNNANTLLAGGDQLWRSTNVKAATPTWSSIKPSIGSCCISAIAVGAGNSDLIWVGHGNGNVYKTTNGTSATPTWTRVDTNTPNLPNRYVMRVSVDPNNSNTVYVTFGGFSSDNIWRTTDGGTTWSDVTGSGVTGLPDAPVRDLDINVNNSNWLYAGTEVGIFTSEDGGANWTVPHDGPTNTSVDELFWIGNDLVAATHGRGLFKASPTTGNAPPNDDIDNATEMTPLPFTDNLDTTSATIAVDDPAFACGSNDTGSETVWYEFTPATDGTLDADTIGSSYDTMLALWTGTRGNLTIVEGACNDDIGGGVLQSQITNVAVQSGVHYYLEVAEYSAAPIVEPKPGADSVIRAGGALNLAVDFTGGQQTTLVVIKQVVNDDGGTLAAGDFTMTVAGSVVPAGTTSFPGEDTPGTSVTLQAGNYSVTEAAVNGYTGSFSADCSGSIAAGETKTCTVTNNDDPIDPATLVVIKQVDNSAGGTAVPGDFTMTVAGSAVPGGTTSFAGEDTPGASVTLQAGNYSVTESAVNNYTGSFSADCTSSIAAGETKTCTVTNTYVPPGEGPELVIPQGIAAFPGSNVPVPVNFLRNGSNISGLQFSVDVGLESVPPGFQNCLVYNSHNLTVPAGFASSTAVYDAVNKKINVQIFSIQFPLPSLPDSQILSMDFAVDPACTPAVGQTINVPVNFSTTDPLEFTSDTGAIVQGSTVNGSVEIFSGQRGDCNGDGNLLVSDIIGNVIEVNDGDGEFWQDAPGGDYPGSPIGCDSNGDTVIRISDVICTVLVVNGGNDSCTQPPVVASSTTAGASLSIDTVTAEAGVQVDVPVKLNRAGQTVAGAAFSLQWDPQVLKLNSDDADGDSIADGIRLHVADDFTVDVTAGDGQVAVIIFDMELPLAELPDGALLTLGFTANEPATDDAQDTAVSFGTEPFASLGSVEGRDVPVITQDGAVTVGIRSTDVNTRWLYLPQISQ